MSGGVVWIDERRFQERQQRLLAAHRKARATVVKSRRKPALYVAGEKRRRHPDRDFRDALWFEFVVLVVVLMLLGSY